MPRGGRPYFDITRAFDFDIAMPRLLTRRPAGVFCRARGSAEARAIAQSTVMPTHVECRRY
jgi:hypothetical protein